MEVWPEVEGGSGFTAAAPAETASLSFIDRSMYLILDRYIS